MSRKHAGQEREDERDQEVDERTESERVDCLGEAKATLDKLSAICE